MSSQSCISVDIEIYHEGLTVLPNSVISDSEKPNQPQSVPVELVSLKQV